MSEITARDLMLTRFTDGYTGGRAYYTPNTDDAAPTPSPSPRPDDGYIYLTWQSGWGGSFQADSDGSGGTFRFPGLFIVSVFCPRGIGSGEGLSEAEAIAALFRGKSDSSGSTQVAYRSPTIREVGSGGQWHQTDVEIPFVRDTIYATS